MSEPKVDIVSNSTTDQPTPGSNTNPERDAIFAHLRELGRTEGKGKTARMKAAEYVCQKAKEGLLEPADNTRAWGEISGGSGEEMGDYGDEDYGNTQQFKQRASELKHFIVLGRNPAIDGPAMLNTAREHMKGWRADGKIKGRAWELYLAFARAQNDAPTKELSEPQIKRAMQGKEPHKRKQSDETLANRLWSLRALLIKFNEGHNYHDVYEACELLEQRVATLGGTTKMRAQPQPPKGKKKLKAAKPDTTKAKSSKKPKITTSVPTKDDPVDEVA
jgi:hypothetical protein